MINSTLKSYISISYQEVFHSIDAKIFTPFDAILLALIQLGKFL